MSHCVMLCSDLLLFFGGTGNPAERMFPRFPYAVKYGSRLGPSNPSVVAVSSCLAIFYALLPILPS